MPITETDLIRFLTSVHPYDSLELATLHDLAPKFQVLSVKSGDSIYELGTDLAGLYLVHHGEVEVFDDNGMAISILGPRNSFGERGLTRGGRAATSARVPSPAITTAFSNIARPLATTPSSAPIHPLSRR